MAFIVAVGSIIIFLDISSAHLEESRDSDIYFAGKRLVESLSGEVFKSENSRAYGNKVLDARLIEDAESRGELETSINIVEYGFHARIETAGGDWDFGESIPDDCMVFSDTATILSDSLANGRITVWIWDK
jgi:hypothetical protein